MRLLFLNAFVVALVLVGPLIAPVGCPQSYVVAQERKIMPDGETGAVQPLPDKYQFSVRAQAPIGQFNRPVSMAAAPDGTVYVADMGNHRIQHFSTTGTWLDGWGFIGTGEGQFAQPHKVAVAADGTVYVADTFNHRIQRFSSSGQFLGKWGSQGSGDGQMNEPQGVDVAPDGTIYVADTGNARIQRFTALGQFLGKWGTLGSGNGEFIGPNGVAVAPDGTVYVADTHNNRIQRFTNTGQFISKWGSYGSADGQFDMAMDVAVAPDGSVYVADFYTNNRVQRFSATGQFLSKWGGFGAGDGQFYWPAGIEVASDSSVYVADSMNHRVQRFTALGQFLGKWGSKGFVDGQFEYPVGLSVAADGSFYVADNWNNRIQRFSATGSFLGKWGRLGGGEGEFNGPCDVSIAPDGTVYVAESGNNRIQRFSSIGQFVGKWGSYGNADGQLAGPCGVATASDGNVYVADTNNHRIQRFSSTGQFLGKWGSKGSADGQFNEPRGVAVAPDGTVYVTDSLNHRIQRFSATGQFLGRWGSNGGGDGQFSLPLRLAIGSDSSVYVVEHWNTRVQKFSATGQFLGKWGTKGGGQGQFYAPEGIAVAQDGKVYVSETFMNDRIQVSATSYAPSWRGEYFPNRWLTGAPALIRNDAAVDFDWGTGTPGSGIPADGFSARWLRYVWFDPGTYRFTVQVDDGVRFWVDDRLLMESWRDQEATLSGDITLSRGYHRLQLEYYENAGGAQVHLNWVPGCSGTTPVDVLLVIDRSSSMSGQPLADEKVAAKGFVDRMNLAQDQVGLASFGSDAALNRQLTHDGNAVKSAIDGLASGGSTNMGGGINVAQAELQSTRHNTAARPVMILMSDGQPDSDSAAISAAQAAKNAGTRIFAIGLGQVDANLMRQLASSPADYYYAPTSADLAAIYQTIAGVVSCAGKVKVSPASKRVPLSGGAFAMEIVAQDVTNLSAYQVELIYNPAIVHITAVAPGPFLGSTGRTVSPVGPVIDNGAGKVIFGAFTFGTQPGVNGTGVLATITFQPRAKGTSALHLQNLQAADPNSVPITQITTEDGQVEIVSCFGDFDNDNDVDIFDLQRAASHWNCKTGQACYDVQYDTEPDGDVDVFDLQRFAAAWGTRCTTAQALQEKRVSADPNTAAAVSLALTPATRQVTLGSVFTQTVYIQDTPAVAGFQTDLVYDPALLQVEDVAIGPFLGSTGRSVTPLGPMIDNPTGRVTFGAFTFGNQPGATGAGDLAYVRFRAKGAGQTTLTFQQTGVSDPQGNPVYLGAIAGSMVTVSAGGQNHVYLPAILRKQ